MAPNKVVLAQQTVSDDPVTTPAVWPSSYVNYVPTNDLILSAPARSARPSTP